MVILIGGASCIGKTLLADRIMREHNIPYYSIDHLKMGLYRGTEECGFTPMDSDDHIGKKIWPIVREIIKTAIENKQNLIIEGAYIFPEYLCQFEEVYSEHILPVFFAFSENYIRENFQTGIIKHRSTIEKRMYEEERKAEEFIEENSSMLRLCDDSKVKCFIIDKKYTKEIENIIFYIQRNINI